MSNLPTLLRQSHAQMYRIALALTGSRSAAQAVAEKVVRRSGAVFKQWETDSDAQRWFVHYTVLLCRSVPMTSSEDLLLNAAGDPDAQAAIRHIRQLPMQQREAFLLHHGEAMELRQMATAMDCSSQAAANHLVAAVQSLRNSGIVGLGDFTQKLPALLRQLMPPADALEQNLQRVIIAQSRRRQARRILLWASQIILILAIGWLAWWMWRSVQFL